MDESRVSSGGQVNDACRTMKDCGVKTGVTDTYGTDLEKGYSNVSGSSSVIENCSAPRMGGC